MKFRKYKIGMLAAVLGLSIIAGPGCKKIDEFGDTNVNPGQTSEPITAALLTNVLAGIGGTTANTRGGLYAQLFSETQYTETSLYAEPKIDFDGTYTGPLMDLQKMINFNSDPATAAKAAANGSNANQIAIARILKAYYFWILTDQYGDIPYAEALKGNSNNKFDTQQSIYNDLFKELKEAAAQFDGGSPVRGDIMYGGDAAKWKKFANSLRLIMALRLSKADVAKGTSEANDAINAGVFTSNADNAVIVYPGGAYVNPWWNLYNGRKDFAMSNVIDVFLTNTADPRLAVFGSSDIGFPYGLTRDQAVAFDNSSGGNWARILAANRRNDNSPVTLLSYSVVLFARAEVRQRGWVTSGPTAQQLYEQGIQANWEEWGLSTAGLATYLANASVAYTAGNEIQRIATQRWLALYPNGLQAWFEWRRTGFPVLTPSPNATNSSKQIPRRYVYGNGSYSTNKVNTEEAAARIGGDTQDTRVWWDKP